MSKMNKKTPADYAKDAADVSRQMIEANHAEKIAGARQKQAEEIEADRENRLRYAAQHDTEMEGEPKTRFNTPAVYEERLWRSLPCSRANLGRTLNQLEQEGWNLVNVTSSGADAYAVVGSRKMMYALPEEPEVEPASEETSSENAPDTVGDLSLESVRKEWLDSLAVPNE